MVTLREALGKTPPTPEEELKSALFSRLSDTWADANIASALTAAKKLHAVAK